MDLAGSTLDIWPLYLFHQKAVTVNIAVNVLTRCRLAPLRGSNIHLKSIDTGREDHFASLQDLCRAKSVQHHLAANLVRFFAPRGGLEVETNSESPAGAGISGSSALMVATTAALARHTGRKLKPEEIRIIAQNTEAQLIQVPTGCQDYYPALYGGINAIELAADGIHRHPISIAPEEIESRFVLAYSGVPRKSGINNWKVFKAHIDGDKKIFRNFEEIARIACEMYTAVSNADWPQVALLLRREWKLRKTNAPGISTPLIDNLVAVASKHGSCGAKVCGAGGGGCVLLMVEHGARERVENALRRAGGQVLPLRVAREGLSVVAGAGR